MDDAEHHGSSAIIEYDAQGNTWFLPEGNATFDWEGNSECTSVTTQGGKVGSTVWIRCPQSWGIRPLVIYSPYRGELTVRDTAPGHQASAKTIHYHWKVIAPSVQGYR